MSPVEVAKAFGSQLVRSEDSNAEVGDLMRELGGVGVRYGVVLPESRRRSEGTKLVEVREEGLERRLQFGLEGNVVPPEKGWRFQGR